jgi:hypothetical protein
MQVSCFNDCRSIIHPLLGALFIVISLHVISSKVAIENSSLLDALVCNGIFLFLSCHHLNIVYLLKRCAYFSSVPSGIHSCVNLHSISEFDSISQWFPSLACLTNPFKTKTKPILYQNLTSVCLLMNPLSYYQSLDI